MDLKIKLRLIAILLFPLISSGCFLNQLAPPENPPTPLTYFCKQDNCTKIVNYVIKNSNEAIYCAFYDLKITSILENLKEKAEELDVKLYIDNTNLQTDYSWIKIHPYSYLMHNKFCIFDHKIVLSGSFNPTYRGNSKNDNHIILFNSKDLSENYEKEFFELWNQKNSKTPNNKIKFQNWHMENFFCPEDGCADKVTNLVLNAKKSVYFMIFSFSHQDISDALIIQKNRGLDIKGVLEKSQNMWWSKFKDLNRSGVNVKLDSNPYFLHHKVFIIDNETVITGSFNPTVNADKKNDENLLIIHNEEVSKKFLKEFNRLFQK